MKMVHVHWEPKAKGASASLRSGNLITRVTLGTSTVKMCHVHGILRRWAISMGKFLVNMPHVHRLRGQMPIFTGRLEH